MGMSAQELLQSDPDYIRRQMAQQEMQRLNPTGSAAGAIGALFGRGLGNIASGRSFMDTGDAGLRRVSDVQRILSSVPFDPQNPAAYYEQVGRALQENGYGDLAPKALQEAAKLGMEAKKIGLQERQVATQEEQVNVSKEKLKYDVENLARQNKLTDAQIREIDARIANLGSDKYEFQQQKDSFGNLIGIIAINKKNPNDVKNIPVASQEAAGKNDKYAGAREEYAKRKPAGARGMDVELPDINTMIGP